MSRARSARRVHVVAPAPYPLSSALSTGNDGRAPTPSNTLMYRSHLLKRTAIAEEHQRTQQQLYDNLIGADQTTREAIADMQAPAVDVGGALDLTPGVTDNGEPMDVDEDDGEWETLDNDEEDEGVQIRDLLRLRCRYHRGEDKWMWGLRLQRLEANWGRVLPRLVDAFLRNRYPPPPPVDILPPLSTPMPQFIFPLQDDPLPGEEEELDGETLFPPPPLPPPPFVPPPPFTIRILDIYLLAKTATIPFQSALSQAEALVANGYLGTVPDQPSLAISLKTLELLRCIKLCKASFSIEAFTKLLCYYYSIPYRRTFRTALADAFDIYLVLINKVKSRVDCALGWDLPNWRACNGCPACGNTLSGEAQRRFSHMFCMDGNSSLKRVRRPGGRQAVDHRVFEDNDYFLPTSFVDEYAQEVSKDPPPVPKEPEDTPAGSAVPGASFSPSAHGEALPAPSVPSETTTPTSHGHASVPATDQHATTLIDGRPTSPLGDESTRPAPGDARTTGDGVLDALLNADPTDGAPHIDSTCTENWKAAMADEKKHTWDIFEETGIFASACRHAITLWITDMVRSGELAKYPLAIVAKALEVFDRPWLCGFDIGCSFQSTVSRSPKLSQRFKDSGSRICVNAFHGYSHSYSCQQYHHPNVINGMGLEDFETMERIFSLSNQLASVVRYTSAYRRRVLVQMYFQRWDEERYQSLGKFIYDNFLQAREIIDTKEPLVLDSLRALDLTVEDLKRFAEEERSYVASLQKEDDRHLHAVAYVQALEELWSVEEQLGIASRKFLAAGPKALAFPDVPEGSPGNTLTFIPAETGPTDYNAEMSKTRRIETNRRYLDQWRKALMLDVAEMEFHLGVEAQWEPNDADFINMKQYIATRDYQVALLNLQRLIVQRLFELHKMNLSQTGYRVRRHIAKSLQARSRTIRTTLDKYNAAARATRRPELDWTQVSHYRFLQEFEILNDTRGDLTGKRWAEPAVRELMRQANRVARAHEEIDRTADEARRVLTSIRDEDILFSAVLEDLVRSRDPLYGAVADYVRRRRHANTLNATYLGKLFQHPEFRGVASPGQREGGPLPALVYTCDLDVLLAWDSEDADAEDDGGDFDDEHAHIMMNSLTDYIAAMHT